MTSSTTSIDHRYRTAIIVLNWNASDDTIACLDSIINLDGQHQVTLIVCDNHSTDDSAHKIKNWAIQYFPAEIDEKSVDVGFVFFRLASNSGYAAGNNIGLQYAIDHGFDFVWILNNDTRVEHDALTALLDCAQQQPDIACWGSTLVNASQPDRIQCAGGSVYNHFTTMRTEIHHQCKLSWALKQNQSIHLDYVCGAASFLRVCAVQKVGLLNQRFFLYYEELDLAQRLKKAGFELGWCKNSVVQHQQFSNKSMTIQQQQFLHYHENLSTLIFTWLHYKPAFIFAALFRLSSKLIILPMTRRQKFLQSLVKAYYDFFTSKHCFNQPIQNSGIVTKSHFLSKK